ncbi:MAG: sulfoxide reductase heme-binding subunit YedZ [Caldilineaceae bacterium]|nr:sulfoxide reductase heme-binding subunit YedZ [Caldilineaceae bacterium]
MTTAAVVPYAKKNWLWLAVNAAAAIPLLQMVVGYATDTLGVDPVATLTTRTGTAAIMTLVLSLACTPANMLFGWRKALTVRKSLGLWAFTYAALHMLVFIGLDYGLDWRFIWQDALLEKQYIFVGLTALLILLPLALTSTKGWMRRLGRNWKRLHQLVYIAGILAVLHYFILVKIDKREPLIYAGVLALLLVLRLPPVRRQVSRVRQRFSRKPGKTAARPPQVVTPPKLEQIG